MGSLGNRRGTSLHKLFELFCTIGPTNMDGEDQKVSLTQRITAALEGMKKIEEELKSEPSGRPSQSDLDAQFATILVVLESIVKDPCWAGRSDKDHAVAVLSAVFESVEKDRVLAQLLAAESSRSRTPATQASTPSSIPLGFSVSFDAAAGGQGDSGVDSERGHIDALRRQVTPDMRLSSVAGMAQAKQLLSEAVVLPIRYPHLFTGARRPWHSVLLYGPPGTGKTRLALALAAEVEAELYAISPADLLSSWFGRTEQNIRDLFGQLRARGASNRVIVFLDEVDGLCRRRTNDEPESTRRMKTELLTQLQGDGQDAAGRLFFVCATNCPWEIDPAFLRRFQRRIFIGLPDRDSRRDIVRMLASGSTAGAGAATELNLPADEWQGLLDRTAGFSGSDLADLVRNALYQPIRELATATHWVPVAGGMWTPCPSNTIGSVRRDLHLLPAEVVCARAVTIRDFHDVIEGARPTVCEADLRRYEEFTNQFGQWG